MAKKEFGAGIDAVFNGSTYHNRSEREDKPEQNGDVEFISDKHKPVKEKAKSQKFNSVKICVMTTECVFEKFKALAYWERFSYGNMLEQILNHYVSSKDEDYFEKALSNYRQYMEQSNQK